METAKKQKKEKSVAGVDFGSMSQDLGISTDTLKDCFKELPTSNVNDVKEACKLFKEFLDGSTQKKAFIKKLNVLIRESVSLAQGIDDLKEFYEFIPLEIDAKKEVNEKWDEFSKKAINSASEIDQIIRAFLSARQEPEIIKLAVAKWVEIIKNIIPSISNFEEALTIFKVKLPFRYAWFVSFYYEDSAYKLVYEKLIQLASTVEEIKIVHKSVNFVGQKRQALARWVELIASVDEAQHLVYEILSKDSDFLSKAKMQWDKFSEKEINLAGTLEDTYIAHDRCYHDSRVRSLAIKKMDDLCLKQIDSFSDYENLIKLLKFCFSGYCSERKITIKLLNLANTLVETQRLYEVFYKRYASHDNFSVKCSYSKWKKKSLEEINSASTFIELRKLSPHIPGGSEEVQLLFINKLINSTFNLEEAVLVCDQLSSLVQMHPWLRDKDPNFLKLADKKLIELAIKEIGAASNLEELSPIKMIIFSIFRKYTDDIGYAKDFFFEKLEKLIKRKLRTTNDKEGLRQLLEYALPKSNSQALIIKKISKFY